MNPSSAAPWSRPLAVTDVPAAGLDIEIVADSGQRAALAELCGLAGVDEARAAFRIARRGRDGLRVEGEARAKARQVCVVSLEPFATEIVEPFALDFAPGDPKPPGRGAPPIDWPDAGADGPDPIVDGRIDLGAIAAEFIALGVDPYPRKPGAAFEGADEAGAGISPFAALKGLRGGGDKKG